MATFNSIRSHVNYSDDVLPIVSDYVSHLARTSDLSIGEVWGRWEVEGVSPGEIAAAAMDWRADTRAARGPVDPMDNPEERMRAAKARGVTTQEAYERCLAEIAKVRLDKVLGYGEDRYSARWAKDVQLWMIYSDIYRKFIRMEQQVRNQDLDGMRETCADIANYGVMGMQIIDQLKENG